MGQGEDPPGSAGAGTVHQGVGRELSGPESPQCQSWGAERAALLLGEVLQVQQGNAGTGRLRSPALPGDISAGASVLGVTQCHRHCPGADGCSTAEPRRQEAQGQRRSAAGSPSRPPCMECSEQDLAFLSPAPNPANLARAVREGREGAVPREPTCARGWGSPGRQLGRAK